MLGRARLALRVGFWTALLLLTAGCAHSEPEPLGPTVSQNGLIVTLELDPNPPRTDGEVVLIDVQDAATQQFIPHADVTLTVTQLNSSHRWMSRKGTDDDNSGIYDADVTLNAPGVWVFDVSVNAGGRTAHLRSVQKAVRPTAIP